MMPKIEGGNNETIRAGFHYDIHTCDTEDGVWVEWWFPKEPTERRVEKALLAMLAKETGRRTNFPYEDREPDGHCFIPMWAFAGLREEMAFVEYRAKDRDDA